MAPDHFSSVAAKYAECRPSYPPALVEYLAGIAPGRALAWDCGTGSGQAAVLLAAHFDRVVATDQSESQLRHAARHPRIEYRHGPERTSGLDDACCDLVTVAQAAHWVDLPAFYAEADRVLKSRGVLAIWGYALVLVAPEIDDVIDEFTHVRVGKYWPPGRELAEDRYRSLPFPYARIEAPAFVMEQHWTAADCLSFIGTWSAVDRCRTAERRDPVAEIGPVLEGLWGAAPRPVRWPIHLLAGCKP